MYQKIGFLFAIIGTLLFSLKSIIIKLAYLEGMTADSVLVFRMLISLPIYVAIFWVYRPKLDILPQKMLRNIILLGFFGYFLASLLDLMSLELISAKLERLALFSYPLLTAILGYLLFKNRISQKVIISLILTYFGLWIVVSEELSLSGDNILLGTTLVLLSALSFAFYVLLAKPIINQVGSILFTSIAMISSTVFGLIYGVIILDFKALSITSTAWILMSFLAIFCTVIPSFLLGESIKRIGSVQTGIIGTLGPVFTIILAISLLGETLSIITSLGIILVIIGVMNLTLKADKSR